MSGDTNANSWTAPSKKTDFFLLKSIVDTVLERLGILDLKVEPDTSKLFSEGVSYINHEGTTLVSFGLVKKGILKHFDIKQQIFYADFQWDEVLKSLKRTGITFKEISKYPEVKRDFALLLDDAVTFKDVYDLGFRTERKLLTQINLFDVYQGTNLPKGKKSYAVSFTLKDTNGTLTDAQIDKILSNLQSNNEKRLKADLR